MSERIFGVERGERSENIQKGHTKLISSKFKISIAYINVYFSNYLKC
jgi:hypothetical protein